MMFYILLLRLVFYDIITTSEKYFWHPVRLAIKKYKITEKSDLFGSVCDGEYENAPVTLAR